MKKGLLFTVAVLATLVVGLLIVPPLLGIDLMARAKAHGLVAYSTDEAVALAYERCTGCHDSEKIVKYCTRCGPPFIVASHFMQKYVEITNQNGLVVEPFTDAELVAIVQVWNALVGNWEVDWKKQDLAKLIAGNKGLLGLLEIPLDQRPIESALQGKRAPGAYIEEQNQPATAGAGAS
ncbi:MAG: hypothetical protein HQL52_03250 [Magnetococcales bacterium]|nr:hypothetical protein [Magnetococcales bacterium]